MKTEFSDAQLADPEVAEASRIIRTCVHCGFCTATCPTYVLLGDERDGPRGRIHMIKNMLENDAPASDTVVTHVDRCLSCLSCMTTCPSGVNYMHLVDRARVHIEKTYKRPPVERLLRNVLGFVLPNKTLMELALRLAPLGRPFRALLPRPAQALLDLSKETQLSDAPAVPALTEAKTQTARVALLTGCVQDVLGRHVHHATLRVLEKLGVSVVAPADAGCCGALNHHLGKEARAKGQAKALIDAWWPQVETLDAIIINASGCGTVIKDYAHLLADDPAYHDKAARIAGLAKDISAFLVDRDFPPIHAVPVKTVAYHSACSLQHGQQVKSAPKTVLEMAGFEVCDVPEGHLCCGSAGTYNILQPEIAGQLRVRKAGHINALQVDAVAAGNIGCITQLGAPVNAPVVHTIELVDWALGGPAPQAITTPKP